MASSAMVNSFLIVILHISEIRMLNFLPNFFFLIDLYAFIIGSYIIWTAVAGVRYSIEHIRTKRVAVLLGQIWKWCAIVIKSSVLLSIWVRIIWFFISRNQCSISGLYINY